MALALSSRTFPVRFRWSAAYNVVIALTAVVIVAIHLRPTVSLLASHPTLLVMSAFGVLAGSLAFLDKPAVGRAGTVISPTVCFTFAVLLCWGLGPALLMQLLATTLVGIKLRRPIMECVGAVAHASLSFAAAALVLWFGQPDPFERHGPTNLVTDALSIIGAVAAWLLVYFILMVISARLRDRRPGWRRPFTAVANTMLFKAALLMLSPVLAVAAHINIGFVPLVFIPLLAVQRMAQLSSERDRAAQTDPLTGLANRTRLKAEFEEIVSGYRGTNPERRATMLLLDLDRFKDVNDTLGHDVGDQLLVAVAQRLAGVELRGGSVARLGGDEFAILSSTSTTAEADALGRAVVAALAEPICLDQLRVDVTASVGIARHLDITDGFTDLMRHADLAMYDAKRRGDSVAAFTVNTVESSPERLGLLADFRNALEADDHEQITVHYQPQVSLRTGQVECVEALLRWRHPVHGPVSTPELLEVVEPTAVMQMLTMRVIDDVVAQQAAWAASGIHLRTSLNISSRDLYSDHIVQHLAARLAEHRVDPAQIQVEITESALLADPTRAHATVARIAALGVAVSLDDFGTGFSSLQHLRKMPIAEIKIDRTFVGGMADNRDDAAIVRSTVEMARLLGIRTVAEGVETEYTRTMLVSAGCNLAQGWLTAHPMPGGELEQWLSQRSTERRTGSRRSTATIARI
jgi:diguanylate cyclase